MFDDLVERCEAMGKDFDRQCEEAAARAVAFDRAYDLLGNLCDLLLPYTSHGDPDSPTYVGHVESEAVIARRNAILASKGPNATPLAEPRRRRSK